MSTRTPGARATPRRSLVAIVLALAFVATSVPARSDPVPAVGPAIIDYTKTYAAAFLHSVIQQLWLGANGDIAPYTGSNTQQTLVLVQCQGECGHTTPGGAMRLELGVIHDRDQGIVETNTTLSLGSGSDRAPTVYQYSTSVPIPRSTTHLAVRVTWKDSGAPYATVWEDIGTPNAIDRHASYGWNDPVTLVRGDTYVVPQTKEMATANHGTPLTIDPDVYDRRAGSHPGQSMVWDFGDGSSLEKTYLTQSTLERRALGPVSKVEDRLSRGACHQIQVTIDDSQGIQNEIASPDGLYKPNNFSGVSQVVQPIGQVCVRNRSPYVDTRFMPDPNDPTHIVVLFKDFGDPDAAAGYDDLRFTVWSNDRTAAGGTDATIVWQGMQSDLLAAKLLFSFPRATFGDGASVCVQDIERDAWVNGAPAQNVDNPSGPVCQDHPSIDEPTPDVRGLAYARIVDAATPGVDVSVDGPITHLTYGVPVGNAQVFEQFLADMADEAERGDPAPRVVEFATVNAPSGQTLDMLVERLFTAGVTIVLPVGVATNGPVRDFDVRGLAASPYVITVGAARADGTAARTDSAAGPTSLFLTKPDITVPVADALPAVAAQLAATTKVALLVLDEELRGVADPTALQATVRALARPQATSDAVGVPQETGAGVLPLQLAGLLPGGPDLDNVSTIDLNDATRQRGLRDILAFPIQPAQSLLQIGVVNGDVRKEGDLALENPNVLRRALADTFAGNVDEGRTTDDAAYSDDDALRPLTTVNITFYAFQDLAIGNLTDAVRTDEIQAGVARLGAYDGPDASGLPFLIPPGLDAAVPGLLAGLAGAARPSYFIDEVTFRPDAPQFQTHCIVPSAKPLGALMDRASAYVRARAMRLSPSPSTDALFAKATSMSLEGKSLADALDRTLSCAALGPRAAAVFQDALHQLDDASDALASPAFLTGIDTEVRVEAERAQRLLLHSILAHDVPVPPRVPLATDPARTHDAPLGAYVGVGRITTHHVCDRDPDTGLVTRCHDMVTTFLATLVITGTFEVRLVDRHYAPMPGRLVTATFLLPGASTCASGGVLPVPGLSIFGKSAGLFGLSSSAQAMTDTDGVARFPFLVPGLYDIHDGFVGFSPRFTYTAGGSIDEEIGFREGDCHPPIPVFLDPLGAWDRLEPILSGLKCGYRATAQHVPVVQARNLLESAAADASCGGRDPDSIQLALGLLSLLEHAALQPPDAHQRIQFVFPQVMQGRFADDVAGTDVDAYNLLDPGPLDRWQFTKDASGVRATGNLVQNNFAILRYDYPLPPNEEVAVLWDFDIDLANAEGVAIYTIREDLPRVLNAWRSLPPPTDTIQAVAKLREIVDTLGEAGDAVQASILASRDACAPINHYRIVPIWGNSPDRVAIKHPDNRSTLMRFHTRECPAYSGHAAFIFWARPNGAAEPTTRVRVHDQRIWTWGGVGNDPAGKGTQVSASWAVATNDSRIEGMDIFVDVHKDARGLLVHTPGGDLSAADVASLQLLHVTDGISATVPGNPFFDLEENLRLDLNGSADDHPWWVETPDPVRCVNHESARTWDATTLAGDPAAVGLLLVAYGAPLDSFLPSNQAAHRWTQVWSCGAAPDPVVYFELARITKDLARRYGGGTWVFEERYGADTPGAQPRPAPTPMPVQVTRWVPGDNTDELDLVYTED